MVRVQEILLNQIKRPLPRQNDPHKVRDLQIKKYPIVFSAGEQGAGSRGQGAGSREQGEEKSF